MTFLQPQGSLQSVIHDRTLNFGNWATKYQPALFQPKRDPNYSLETILHFFFRQLHQPYSEVMIMDEDRRDAIMKMELDIIEKENKKAKGSNG
jgi:hypothetical protein